ncbi:hypothetical protein PPERSA_04664 [Pseudocohnilembus persalinus]|uniref:Uncharacterized protein n=1 Tax=Pseudocohnilembus persalinus TaxID=266149 RepID=A0A0V0R4G4_PSEPJ|nr:hypothetical protein PPERSA_04664 [Pseudocohnilembus persalinus]|eukprot:KRX09358.1 hypothetical protein PPERSA_04664 [Pseudocohnilembus persalinus]
MYLDKKAKNLPNLDNLYNTISNIKVAKNPSNLVEPCQVNDKYNPRVAYQSQRMPLLPDPIEDFKLGIPEATQDIPFIHSLVSKGRLLRAANFSKQVPYNTKVHEDIFTQDQINSQNLTKKLNQKFGDPEVKQYVQPLGIHNHNTQFLNMPQPKKIQENQFVSRERNYDEQLMENIYKLQKEGNDQNIQKSVVFKNNMLQNVNQRQNILEQNQINSQKKRENQVIKKEDYIKQKQQEYEQKLQKKLAENAAKQHLIRTGQYNQQKPNNSDRYLEQQIKNRSKIVQNYLYG